MMKKQRSRALSTLMLSVVLLLMIPGSTVSSIFRFLFGRPLTIQRLQFIWKIRPEAILYAAFYLFCLLLLVSSLIRLIRGAGGKQTRSKRSAVRKAEAKQPEEAIHCEHKTGTDKYMEQIEGFLKSGLIEKDEYRLLRDRYAKLNIPDDYH